MGKYRSFILFGIAIIVALITGFLVVKYLQTKSKGKEVALETRQIAVAKVDLTWGTAITPEVISTKPFLKDSLPGGYFSDPSSLTGRVLISNIKANEPIFESKLAPTTVKTGGVAALISPKKRAISVRVDRVIGVAGFVHPGNRVDVLVTMQSGKAGAPTTITKIVLENMLVLATGQEIQTKGKEEKATPVEVITLEVTPEEAEKLALAATEGKILLALRNFSDSEDVITKGMTIPVLLTSYSTYGSVQEAKAVPLRATGGRRPTPMMAKKPETGKPDLEKKPAFTVELIKGTKVSEVKFEGGE